MTQYKHPVNVPIRVDALWSDGQTQQSPPTADFTRLQKTTTTENNFSNCSPWLGDYVRHEPDDNYWLAKGLHLHWTLPQGLRHGTTVYALDYAVFNELVQQGVPCELVQSLKNSATLDAELTLDELTALLNKLAPGSGFTPLAATDFNPTAKRTYSGVISSIVAADTCTPALKWDPIFLELYGPLIVQAAARMKLPPVPNRWLVLRTGGGGPKTWVVESDRLTTPNDDGTAPAGAGPAAVPGMFSNDFVNTNGNVPAIPDTFQYLGLSTLAQRWQEHCAPGDQTLILAPLTAVGSGVVDFAAFYPNCQGVFGFCDTTADESTAYVYTIIGWFADPTNDPAASAYSVTPWSAMSVSDRTSGRFPSLGWQVPADDTIDGSVYTAQISVTGTGCTARKYNDPMDSVQVAVGNTAGEALAAYLGDPSKDDTLPWGLSSQTVLDAAQAGVLRRVMEADGPAVVEETLHGQAFQAQSVGFRWVASPVAPTQPGLSPKQPTPLPVLTVDVETALSALNAAQLQFDRTQAYLTAHRRLLFTDWCRNLHLATDESVVQQSDNPNSDTSNSNGGGVKIGALAATLASLQEGTPAWAVQAAGMGNGDNQYMLGYWAAKALYLAYAAAAQALRNMTGGDRYTLVRRAAPRFYQPNDPAVLFLDQEGGSLTTSPADSLKTVTVQSGDHETWLVCSVLTAGGSPSAGLPDAWPDGPSSNCVATVQSSITPVQGAQSWRPISLTWEAQCYPYPEAGSIVDTPYGSGNYSVTNYPSSFLIDNFQLDAAGVDLIAKPTASPGDSPGLYHGRVVLSDHATTTLRARILQLAGQDPNSPPESLKPEMLPGALGQGEVAKLLIQAYASAQSCVTLAQVLDCFNDQLLKLRRIPQTSLFDPGYNNADWMSDSNPDPIWDPDSQSFYLQVGRQHAASPQLEESCRYSPIRAGRCELTTLWLVDSFGQSRKWSLGTDNVYFPPTLPKMTAKAQDAPAFFLPPRLAQPGRLLFRWVAGDGSGVESVGDASTSPICGWVMLNRVDESLMFFAKSGALLGWVPTTDGPAVCWPPNQAFPPADGSLLTQVIQQAQASGDAARKMYDDIATALLTIEPRAHRQHWASSVLFSRPLALACATLQLEVLGGPAPHQGYEWLATTPITDDGVPPTDPYCPVQADNTVTPASPFLQRETCKFEEVTFPVRLGDVSMDDDGLVAYWTLATDNSIASSYCLVDPATGDEPTLPMTVDPAAAPTSVLLLLDPRAPVHAVSGILPTKIIDIPPEMFTAAVKNMELLFTVGPVLSPGTSSDPPLLPLPTEIRGTWSWTESGTTTGTPMSGQIDDRAHLSPEPPVLRSGWLSLPGAGGK